MVRVYSGASTRMSVGRFLQQAAAGNAGAVYVDDVFSTYLYKGNNTERDIQNGLDLSGEGGLVWIKDRLSGAHTLSDTENGANKYLSSSSIANLANSNAGVEALKAFNSDGFKLPGTTSTDPNKINGTGYEYVSWSFRRAPGFFDIVTYTGNAIAGTEIAHNLGSAPGMIIVKRTNSTSNWVVYHRSSNILVLNSTAAASSTAITAARFGDGTNVIAPTESVFTIGGDADTNQSGSTYVAYLFAHDAQDFGTNSDESIIKCGSYTGNGGVTGPVIDLGFEPQWLLVKGVTSGSAYDWRIHDVMRGFTADGDGAKLEPNTSDAEDTAECRFRPLPNGFQPTSSVAVVNAQNETYIYVAIRRPHKPAKEFAATDLFKTVTGTGNPAPDFISGFPVDMYFNRRPATSDNWNWSSRLTQGKILQSNLTNAESTNADFSFDYQNGVMNGGFGSTLQSWMFRRAPGFFDVVTYRGTGSLQNVTHNLNAAPEMLVVKTRSTYGSWMTYHSGLNGGTNPEGYYAKIEGTNAQITDSSGAVWNNTAPTSSQFTVNTLSSVNISGHTFVAYLFATVPGISKVGRYTGTGANVDVDCGFTSGARFVLVKRTDGAASWYLFDAVRGIVAGNDPMINLNTTNPEFTGADYIDPLSSGFTITSSASGDLNASGGNYIFLAIA